jgi:alpha-1,2-mannosyltransferase
MRQRVERRPGAGAWGRGRLLQGRPSDVARDAALLAAIALIAFLVRAIPVLVGGGLDGYLAYDDGVYFGAAIALVHGELPYRDVLLLHPPGMVAALVPFAVLGSTVGDAPAFATARVAIMAVGAINTILAGLVAGRYGRAAGVLAAALYATWNVAAVGERTTDLHAPQHLLVLIALLLLAGPGRIRIGRGVAAGAVLGLATSIQLWQGATLLIAVWWLGVRAVDGRELRTVICAAAGAFATFTLVAGPFLAVAPEAMVRQSILDQLGRPHTGVGIADRLLVLEGGAPRASLPPALRAFIPVPLVLATALAGLALLLATAWKRSWTRPWVALSFLQASIVLTTPSFFSDYGAFIAPATTVALATGLVVTGAWLIAHRVRPRVVVTGFVVLFVVLVASSAVLPRGRPLPLDALRADLATARCVAADAAAVAVLTGTLRRNAEHGCRIVVDPTGIAYDTDRGRRYPTPHSWRVHAPGYQAAMEAWYTGVDAAVFVRPRSNDLTKAVSAAVRRALPVAIVRDFVIVRLPADR